MVNTLSKKVHNFWLYCMTFGGFQAFKTDLRSMVKSSNSIKPNLPVHDTKVTSSTAPY